MSSEIEQNALEGCVEVSLGTVGGMHPQLVKQLLDLNSPQFLKHALQCGNEGPKSISFDVKNLVSLRERLNSSFSLLELGQLLSQFRLTLESCLEGALPFVNLVLDLDYIYLDGGLTQIRFIYLPVSKRPIDANQVKSFFENLFLSIHTDSDYGREELDILKGTLTKMKGVDLSLLSTVMGNLAKASFSALSEQNPPQPIPSFKTPLKEMKADGSKSSSEGEPYAMTHSTNPGTIVLEPMNFDSISEVINEPSDNEHKREERASKIGKQPNKKATADNSKRASNIQQENGKKKQLSSKAHEKTEPKKQNMHFYLVSPTLSDTIEISKNPFKVGKSKRADFQIPNTSTVSRLHAIFEVAGKDCFVEDNNSLNGTFVNDSKLKKGDKLKLKNGDVIRLSDEEFVFEASKERR